MVDKKLAKWEIDTHFSINEAINLVKDEENIKSTVLVSIK